jgi:hypothetical protein
MLENILKEQDFDKNQGSGGGTGPFDPNQGSGGGTSNTTQLQSTPFRTQAEGDAFRAWVIKTDATYAGQIGLDATGPINNTTIKKAYKKYGTQYQQSLTSSGGTTQQPSGSNSKLVFDTYNKQIFFLSKNNEKYPVVFDTAISDEIDSFLNAGFNKPSAFLGGILMNYGKLITKYQTRQNVQDEIEKNLVDLQQTLNKRLNENFKFKKPTGLAQILEQISPLVTVMVINGVPQKPSEDDNYKKTDNKYIETVVQGGDEIRPGERNNTVKLVKQKVGYNVVGDTGNNFTEEFKNFLLNYKSNKLLDYNNPNISKVLLCSFDDIKRAYSTYCVTVPKPTQTTPATTQTTPSPTPTST